VTNQIKLTNCVSRQSLSNESAVTNTIYQILNWLSRPIY